MKTIISMFVLSIFACGNLNAQSVEYKIKDDKIKVKKEGYMHHGHSYRDRDRDRSTVVEERSVTREFRGEYPNTVRKEITQVNPGPTLVEIKDGDVMVNGEVVSTIADKTECLKLRINTECSAPKKMVKADCDPCKRRYNSCYKPRLGCNTCRTAYRDRYDYYDTDTYTGYYPRRYYESYRTGTYTGYKAKHKDCGCDKHRD